VATSNVDGQFQRAGFDAERIAEVHGSIECMQCTKRCGVGLFPADPYHVQVDESTCRATGVLPACPACGALARPNIFMFGDLDWDGSRSAGQHKRLNAWLGMPSPRRVTIIECGAGLGIPAVRRFSEQAAAQLGAKLIRINPREPEAPAGQIALQQSALAALKAIDALLASQRSRREAVRGHPR
jgi:NAD-dependent SIR2 family protein deacetylase